MLASALVAACAARPAVRAGAPVATVEVTVRETGAGHWQVSYRLPPDTTAVRFRHAYPFRATRWQLAAGFVAEEEVVRRADRGPMPSLVIDIPVHVDRPEKDYPLFIPFTDGGILIYTGYFDVVPLAASGAVETWFTFVPRPSERVTVAGAVDERPARWRSIPEGTYVYFGATAPTATPLLTAIVDRGFPSWLLRRIDDELPALFALYTRRTGQPLRFRPTVYLSYGPPPSSRGVISIGGGTVPPGVLQQDVTLGLNHRGEGDREVLTITLGSVAHEAAHLWNGEQFTNEVAGGGWMHEGGADAFAARALVELGITDRAHYREQLSSAASLCALALGGPPLRALPPGRADYTCGFLIAAVSEAAARRRDPHGDIFSFWGALFAATPGRRYDDTLYLATLERVGAAEPAAAVRRLVAEENLASPGALVEAALRTGGGGLRADDGAASDEYRRTTARRALGAMAAADCGPDGRVVPGDGFVTIDGPCRTLRPGHRIQRLAGVDVRTAGPAAYDGVRERCGRGEPVPVGLSDGATLEVPCRRDLPPRPPYLVVERWPPIDD